MIRKRLLAAGLALTVAGAQPAAAESHKVLVMQTEGRADAATRAKIDAAILKLARTSEAQVSLGEITFADAAAAVGCQPEDRKCKDEVLGMLAVDEIVFTTVTPKPGGLEIAVHRVTKGNASRDAQMTLATGQPMDRLDEIAPLFGTVATTNAVTTIPVTSPTEQRTSSPTLTPPPDSAQPQPLPLPPPMTTLSNPTRDEPDRYAGRRRLEIVGMAGGGTMVLVGFLLWGQTTSLQSEINSAPNLTHSDLENIAALEKRGDSFAGWGNVMFLGGAIIGGISGYYFWKDRRAQRSTMARITPTLFDHGAGIAFTIGGSP